MITTVEVECRRWLASQDEAALNDHQRRVAHIVLDHVTELNELGTAAGKRAKRIVELVDAQRGLPVPPTGSVIGKSPGPRMAATRVLSLKVGPFRGFESNEVVNLDRDVVLLYGPNGSGKTSFCEALEYAFLGKIEEAESRRMRVEDYIKNARIGRADRPRLTIRDSAGSVVELRPDLERFRFFFLEKNRIDGFARVDAQTPANQTARVSALFGLEQFNHFVSQFSPSIAGYSSLSTPLAVALTEKEASGDGFRASLEEEPERLADLDVEEDRLLSTLATLAGQVPTRRELFDATAEGGCELSRVEALLDARAAAHVLAPQALGVQKVAKDLRSAVEARMQLKARHAEQAAAVSFKQLWAAIVGLRGTDESQCPACDTPVERVVLNPFTRAIGELDHLQELAQLEERIKEAGGGVRRAWAATVAEVDMVNRRAVEAGAPPPLPPSRFDPHIDGSDVESAILLDRCAVIEGAAAAIDAVAVAVALHNKRVDTGEVERRNARARREVLIAGKEQLAAVDRSRRDRKERLQMANAALRSLAEELDALREPVATEAATVMDTKRYCDAYEWLVGSLGDYRDSRPNELMKDLGERSRSFYNALNADDPVRHKLASLSLPASVGDRIELRFEGEPAGATHSALHVLSEGHVRCLGLSILLAKSALDGAPILIFDDVVNAIDDEHRSAVADVLMRHPDLAGKQMIVTTHGEEFVKSLEMCFSAQELKKRVARLDFAHPSETPGVSVRLGSARHYVARAEAALAGGLLREALAHSRRALENAVFRVWRRMAKTYQMDMSVVMRGPTGGPDLRSVVDALQKRLRELEKASLSTNRVQLIELLSQAVTNWDYLNKGTHEEEPRVEFVRPKVELVVGVVSRTVELTTQEGLQL